MDKPEAVQIGLTPEQQMTEGQREIIRSAKGSMAGQIAQPETPTVDHDDIEMWFRTLMQMARHLAKKYGFTIKQWPEK